MARPFFQGVCSSWVLACVLLSGCGADTLPEPFPDGQGGENAGANDTDDSDNTDTSSGETGTTPPDGDNNNNGDNGNPLSQLYIDSNIAVCTGVFQRSCLRTKTREDAETEFFYDAIENFTFQWGRNYVLEILTSEVENPPADGSSLRYSLVSVIEETEDDIGTEYVFESVALWENTVSKNANAYDFLGHTFTCGESVNCDTLVVLSGSGGVVNLTFEYRSNGVVTLVNWD